MTGFVTLSADRHMLELDGSPFLFCGANCYYLMTRGADPGLRHEVTNVLDAMQAAGLTVVRTWAFNDGKEWNALQTGPGEFDERVFCGLDFVLAEAARRNLKVMLVLINYWKEYGGMAQYARWSAERRGADPAAARAEEFYADAWAQSVFHNYMATLTSRINTITGTAYRDDPTIMAWSLANEPRCQGDWSGSILQGWLETTAESLKSIDSNHLVTFSSEGFLGSSTPDLMVDNPFDSLSLGCDFARNFGCRHLDFACMHLWPDMWTPSANEEHKLRFARRWINVHADVATQLCKPLVLAEFGKKAGKDGERADFFQKVYDTVSERVARRQGFAGSLYWHCAAASYPDYDGTTVYLEPAGPLSPADARVLRLIREHAAAMASTCAAPPSLQMPVQQQSQQQPHSGRGHGKTAFLKSLGRSIRDKISRT